MPFYKIMGLSLKLEVRANSYVLVTNLITQEQIKVTFYFLQTVTKSSLSTLAQDKHYELILEAEKHWNNISKFQAGKETEILKEIEVKDKPQKQDINNDFNMLLKSQQSYNGALIALEYADYCLEHDYRYNFKRGVDRQERAKEEQIIILQRENKALRERIAKLEAKYIDSANVLLSEATDYIIGEILS